MNKEYIYLSDNEIIVTDENGHTEKRIVECDDMHELLLLENNLENINNLINKIETKFSDDNELKLSFLEKIFEGTFPFLVTAILAGMRFGISAITNEPTPNVFYISVLSSGAILSGTLDIYAVLVDKQRKRDRIGSQNKLSKAYEIKEELEEKLANIRIQAMSKIKKDEITPAKYEVIALENNNVESEEMQRRLNDSYMQGYNQAKVRKLTFKK